MSTLDSEALPLLRGCTHRTEPRSKLRDVQLHGMYKVQKAEMRGRDTQDDDPRLFSPTRMKRKSITAQAHTRARAYTIYAMSETLPAFFVTMNLGIALCCLYEYHLVVSRPTKSDIPANIPTTTSPTVHKHSYPYTLHTRRHHYFLTWKSAKLKSPEQQPLNAVTRTVLLF